MLIRAHRKTIISISLLIIKIHFKD